MKLVPLLILGLVHVADAASSVTPNPDLADIKETMMEKVRFTQIKSKGLITRMKQNAMTRQFREHDNYYYEDNDQDDYYGYNDDCYVQENAYYNDTAISSASFTQILTGDGTADATIFDPNFDLDGFFESMNFDAECEAMGGEVYGLDIDVSCGEDSTTLENYKHCKPPSCNEFEYVYNKAWGYLIIGFFQGCEEVKVISDVIPSLGCMSDLSETYADGTGIEDFEPVNFLSNEGPEYVEDGGYCKSYWGKGNVKVCNMVNLKSEYDQIASVCQTDLYQLDITIDAPYYHRTFMKYPLCKPASCTDNDIKLWYDYVAEMFSAEEFKYYTKIEKGLSNTCDEVVSDKSLMKKIKGGRALTRSCKWLKRRPSQIKEKYCSKSITYAEYQPAQEVCPSTCCKCIEDSEDVFLKKSKQDDDGVLDIQTGTCGWLSRIPEEARNYHCEKKSSSYIKGYPPASVACPQTCETCPM